MVTLMVQKIIIALKIQATFFALTKYPNKNLIFLQCNLVQTSMPPFKMNYIVIKI